jgi:hypothetical protein
MKPHSFIRVIRMWYNECTEPSLRCFINSKGLSYEDMLVGVVPELTIWLTV